MAKSDDWRKASADLCSSITESSSSASQTFGCLLQELNAFIYPVDGLPEAVSVVAWCVYNISYSSCSYICTPCDIHQLQDVHQFLCAVTLTSSVYSPRTVPQLAQLCYSIYSTLKVKTTWSMHTGHMKTAFAQLILYPEQPTPACG